MTQYEKSAATLELPAILAMLAHHAVSDEAKARAAALSPSTDAATVQRLLAETSAARGMMVKRGSPSFSGVKDVRASLSRADMGGTLNIRELMDIAGVLTAARMARTYAAGDGRGNEKTCIDGLFNSLITNRFLEDKITGSIAAEDELSDAGVTFQVDCQCPQEQVICNWEHMRRFLGNLIGNSFQHAETGHLELRLQCRKEEEELVLRFQDNGRGVAPALLQQIFEPLYTSDPGRKVSGLGLSICKSIIRAHGGSISAENVPAGGLLIRASLPCVKV